MVLKDTKYEATGVNSFKHRFHKEWRCALRKGISSRGEILEGLHLSFLLCAENSDSSSISCNVSETILIIHLDKSVLVISSFLG